MANIALQLTGQATPSTRIPFLRYDSINTSKPQPLIIHLHGAGEGGFLPHDTTTVLTLDNSGVGIMNMTLSASLPSFTDPVTGEVFDFYMLAPQLYYPAGTSTAFGVPWTALYVTAMVNYALNPANGMNVDPQRIYLAGLSLGGGGVVSLMMDNTVSIYIAAAFACCPGYGNSSSLAHENWARNGVPLWMAHAINDASAPPSNSEQIARFINAEHPIRSPKYWRLASGGHTIWMQFYSTGHTNKPLENGFTGVFTPNLFEWFLQYKKPSFTLPLYNVT